jgi:hypothetical protein
MALVYVISLPACRTIFFAEHSYTYVEAKVARKLLVSLYSALIGVSFVIMACAYLTLFTHYFVGHSLPEAAAQMWSDMVVNVPSLFLFIDLTGLAISTLMLIWADEGERGLVCYYSFMDLCYVRGTKLLTVLCRQGLDLSFYIPFCTALSVLLLVSACMPFRGSTS